MNREPDVGGPGHLTPETLAELEELVRRRLGARVREFRLSFRDSGHGHLSFRVRSPPHSCSHCVSPGGETMKAHWNYRPDLRACELEDRLVPAIPDLGAIVLTTGGYVLLLSPFPVIAADPFGRFGRPRLPHAVRHGGLRGRLRPAAGEQRRRPRPRRDGADRIEWGSRRDDHRRLRGRRSRRREHPAGHAQHHRQRRPQCRACHWPCVGGPVRRLAARTGLSGRLAGDRYGRLLHGGARPTGRAGAGSGTSRSVAASAPEKTAPPRLRCLGESHPIARGSGAVILRGRHRSARRYSDPWNWDRLKGEEIAMATTYDGRSEPANEAGPTRAGAAPAEARDGPRPPQADATARPDHQAADAAADPRLGHPTARGRGAGAPVAQMAAAGGGRGRPGGRRVLLDPLRGNAC